MRGEARSVTRAARREGGASARALPLYTTFGPTASGRARHLFSCLTRCRTLWSRQARLRPLCSDAEMDGATQLAIALSLSNRASRRPYPRLYRNHVTPITPTRRGHERHGASRHLGRPMGAGRFLRHAATAECYAAQPPVEVMEPSISESDQLALALELSLQGQGSRGGVGGGEGDGA